ncbi:RNA chaperone ProQ [Thalassotalea ponticola]|uniref:RNA chaperone ProQ n=1 Tax=Thalassotalea ponticola TaxID=1523392 RepID=UPI0025B2DD06|nr:RNA chaperone ProQ [Thalassotalea ponticola]MDN3652742.1 RNA chaperone ProQ [Thalassotalea ponticola]
METKRITSKEVIAYLAEKFPACFSLQGQAKPLKVGIFQDLADALNDDEKVSKTQLRQALRHYTSSWRYLKSIKVGEQRIDLQGEAVAEIDQDQADYAAKSLKESQEKFSNKTPQDKKEKTAYKGTKQVDKRSEEKAKKFKVGKAKKSSAKAKPAVKLTQADATQLAVGAQVMVQFGNSPIAATITEVAGKDVSVQLVSGMIVKTQADKIFTQ